MWVHLVIRRLARWSVWAFYSNVHVLCPDNIPGDGPLLVLCTHHNMMLDPAILSCTFPYQRILHYWSKASLFKVHPLAAYILSSAGNIPVDRRASDNQRLFRSTFEVLAQPGGGAVALFPEGTSYTAPHILQIKDGAAWTALEYTKWVATSAKESPRKRLAVVPVAIIYTDKSQYRSSVIVHYGRPLDMEPFVTDFASTTEGAQRAAVKGFTAQLEQRLNYMTLNAPDWDNLYAVKMARAMLWPDQTQLHLSDFLPVSKKLVEFFADPAQADTARALVRYAALLGAARMSHAALVGIPLASPDRTSDALGALFDAGSALIARAPFGALPALVHALAYFGARTLARVAEDGEESRAQSKCVAGLLILGVAVYPGVVIGLWLAGLWFPYAVAAVVFIAVLHGWVIDGLYVHAQRFVAAWRVLIAPDVARVPQAQIEKFATPPPPPENEWLTARKPSPGGTPPAESAQAAALGPKSPQQDRAAQPPPPAALPTPRVRLGRAVLRERQLAARALAAALAEPGAAGTMEFLSVRGARVGKLLVGDEADDDDAAGQAEAAAREAKQREKEREADSDDGEWVGAGYAQ